MQRPFPLFPEPGGTVTLNRWNLRALVPFLLGLLAPATVAAANSLWEFRLTDIRTGETHALERYAGRPTFLIFFEPGCPWCLKQMAALDRLEAECEGRFRTVTAGVHGDIVAYRRGLQRSGTDLPAYATSDRLSAALGGVRFTPYTLFLDGAGQPTHRLRGYIPREDLLTWLRERGIRCPGPTE
jgi:thiol-disulfide isomerase/thioredoxin